MGSLPPVRGISQISQSSERIKPAKDAPFCFIHAFISDAHENKTRVNIRVVVIWASTLVCEGSRDLVEVVIKLYNKKEVKNGSPI